MIGTVVNKVGIVILNYNNYKETIMCADSTLEQIGVELEIVIVDNGSTNESAIVLGEYARSHKNIVVICLDKNIGYAKGNNIGIKELRKKNCEFIVISNSDIIYTEKNILSVIYKSYRKGIGIITPSIKNLDGTYELHTKFKKKLFYIRMLKYLLFLIYDVKDISKATIYTEIQTDSEPKSLDEYYALIGAFFVLTPDYLRHFDFLYPETFLYGEECATLILNKKAGLDTMLVNTPIVIHKRGGSTAKELSEGSRKKRIYMADSAKRIIRLLFSSYKRIINRQGAV